jgi:hypothetical protein
VFFGQKATNSSSAELSELARSNGDLLSPRTRSDLMETLEPSQPDSHIGSVKLCVTCHTLDFEKANRMVMFHAWSLCLTYAALLTARTRGCAFCDILASIFEQLWQGSRRKLEDANPSVTVSVPTREIDNLAASFDSPTPRPFYAGVEEQCIDLVLTVPRKCKLMERET